MTERAHVLAAYVKNSSRRRLSPASIDEAVAFLDDKSIPEPNSGCQLWIGGTDSDGYGRARFKKREIKAHRLAYICAHGIPPAGSLILHSCDTRCCINSAHLSPGSPAENSKQMVERGRAKAHRGDQYYTRRVGSKMKGEANGQARLNGNDVALIRALAGPRQRIAAKFGVSIETIRKVQLGITWRHIQ